MPMTVTEVGKLLTVLSELDNRTVTVEKAAAWHMSIGFLDFDVALEAVRDASRNATIEYIDTKHIVAHAQAVLHRRERAQAKISDHGDWNGDPSPDNMDDYVAAAIDLHKATKAGDVDAMADGKRRFDAETAKYHEQLRDAGIDPNHRRYPYK